MKNKEKLINFKKEIENIELTYNYEKTYCDLINATINYQNDTQNWIFEYIFEDYISEADLKYLIQDKELWEIRNILENATTEADFFKIDAYGYAYNLEYSDLEYIKEEILSTIENELNEEE